MKNINKTIWSPQEKQKLFQSRSEYEALYGGAAGGGKSDALLTEALRQVHIPHYRAIIFRKTCPQLSELVDRSVAIYKTAFPDAVYNTTKYTWTFKSGAKIMFSHMQHSKNRLDHQGKRYDFIAFDELTHFTWQEYSYMFSRNRPGAPGTRVYMRATTNPGGIGHGWVKDRFITPVPPMTPIEDKYDVVSPDGKIHKLSRKRIFIPSTVFDNKALLSADPMYIANLSMLPEAEKRALLYGDWDSFSGQIFSEWKNDPGHYSDRVFTHVIKPFHIPKNWRIYRGFDFGYAKPFAVGWYAVDHDGRMYRIRELYGCTDNPNTGVRWEPNEIARKIKDIEYNDVNLSGRRIIGIADPSIFDESRGESIAAMMERHRVYFERADNKRIPGKMQIHYRLAFDESGLPMFYCFNTCRHFIRTIPGLVYDEQDVEDVDTRTEDHIYDEFRYVAMENPVPPRVSRSLRYIGEDPLDQRTEEKYGRYDFYSM